MFSILNLFPVVFIVFSSLRGQLKHEHVEVLLAQYDPAG